MDENELREIQKIAQSHHITVADWVRQVLRVARQREPMGNAREKLNAVHVAVLHDFPTSDVGQMLADIEQGYNPDKL